MTEQPKEPKNSSDINWKNIDLETAKHVFERSEAFISSQYQGTFANESRAMSLTQLTVSLGLAVAGAGIAFYQETDNFPILISAIVAALIFWLAAFFSIVSVYPRDNYTPGNKPSNYWDIIEKSQLDVVLGDILIIDEHIDINTKSLLKHAKYILWSLNLTIAAPIAGAIIGLITYLFYLYADV